MAFVITAVAAAIETTTVATVLTAISLAGTTMSVVGAVTGNKNLMKIGGEIGLVGGIGSLAAGAISSASGAASEGLSGGLDGAAGDSAESWLGSDAANGMSGAATSSIANPADGITQDLGKTSLNASPSTDAWDQITQNKSGATPGGIINQQMAQPTATVADTSSGSPAAGQDNSQLGSIDDPSNYDGPAELRPRPWSGVRTPADGFADKLKNLWSGLSPQERAEFIKSGLAIPGGIQAQSNKEAELAIQQQRVNQTSYGSQVPTFGIINKARG